MFDRVAFGRTTAALSRSPAVALLGARQVGKTTLARRVAATHPGAVFLDLEDPADLLKLDDAALFLSRQRDRLVIVDEVQRRPDLFPMLRVEIDAARRPGRFLLLGSAAPELLRQSAETLAGRLAMIDMQPLLVDEVQTGFDGLLDLWSRGGFPESYLAASEAGSYAWRRDFTRTFLERDIAQFGLRLSPTDLGRLWRMLAHQHGQLADLSRIAGALGVTGPTIARWTGVLEAARMVRRLEPLHADLGKRLVKSPKLYVTDSGLVHALLGLEDVSALQGHPIAGASWEGFVIEQIAGLLGGDADLAF
nr:ATP-binding protein [Burkholderiales bacterium]